MKLNSTTYRFSLLLLVLLVACTTKKNTLVTRTYHNTTDRWNIQFNANESFKEGVAKIEEAKEDYTKLLPVFIYGTNESSKTIYPQMDVAIKKASTAISRHSIFIKGKEYCKYIDDNYFLIGKANLYKRDYFAAIEDFDYVAKQYKRQNTHFDAMLWMIRSYLELGSIESAQQMFNVIDEDKKFPKKEKAKELELLQTDFMIKQKNNELAIDHLKKVLPLEKNKRKKARYTFLLAQLYQANKDGKSASENYAKVLKLHPNYEMAFYAKINLARTADASSSNTAQIRKQLKKMAKDAKYVDFKDQIYYALAELEEHEGNTEQEIKYLNLSVRSSTTNTQQKALSHLKLADYYFEQPKYRLAQMHYDSSLTTLPKDYPDYSDIVSKSKSLNRLVDNLDIIVREDSLQGLAKMTDKEREALINKHIDDLVKAYEKKKEEDKIAAANAGTNNTGTSGGPAVADAGSGMWYFYNPTTVGIGMADFKKKWGDRKLEDNWRRSDKQTILAVTDSSGNAVVVTEEVKDEKALNQIKDKGQYLKDVPTSDTAMAASTKKIIDAYYKVGGIYREELSNNTKAIENFEELLARFPENEYKLTTYYQLYRLYLATNNAALAEKYKSIILKDYEFTEYGQLVSNPDFNLQADKAKFKAEKMYEQAYEDFQEGEYNSVIILAGTAESHYKKSEYLSKFAYLKAISLGKIESLERMEKELRLFLVKYPDDPLKPQAELVLKMIGEKYGEVKPDSLQSDSSLILYKTNHEGEQYYCMLFPDKWGKIDDIKIRLSNFNTKYFSLQEFSMVVIKLDDNTQAVMVKKFDKKEKGMDYFVAIKENKEVLSDTERMEVKQFIITPDNFTTLYQKKQVEKYMQFFQKEYLGAKTQ